MSFLKLNLSEIHKSGLLVQRNTRELTDQQLIKLTYEIGCGPLKWDFGTIMHMKSNEQASNYLFSKEEVPLHWDGAFSTQPRFLIFYCLESNGKGGETTFCDTRKVIKTLSAQDIIEFENIVISYETNKIAHYGGKIEVPLLANIDGQQSIRFAQKVKTKLNPVQMSFLNKNKKEANKLYNKINNYVTNKSCNYIHQWQRGDLIIVDNRYFLHSRAALGKNINRSFKRIQAI